MLLSIYGYRIHRILHAQVTLLPDGTRYLVHPDYLIIGHKVRGGIGCDRGIPALVDPVFISADAACAWLDDDELVLGLVLDTAVRAYPRQIMVWHEVVNDTVGDTPIVVTYCPLSTTSTAYERTINGQIVQFGVSGKLYNSNLVMYDDITQSLWSQLDGRAIIGPMTGHTLRPLCLLSMPWKVWRSLYPTTQVLARETGFMRRYGIDPYQHEAVSPLGHIGNDDRLPPHTPVIGITTDAGDKAYPSDMLELGRVMNDAIGDVPLVVIAYALDGYCPVSLFFDRRVCDRVLTFVMHDTCCIDTTTGSVWDMHGIAVQGPLAGIQLRRMPTETTTWGTWVAFYPDTQVAYS